MYLDAQPTRCPTAILYDSGSNKPQFSAQIPFGTTGGTSDGNFLEFANNICPHYCPVIPTCDPADYEMICNLPITDAPVITHEITSIGTDPTT